FLDEAHLLFDDASEAFLDALTRTVRLIRSQGVGVFFVTQTPKDVPGDVLAQLGNRVQHALRAFTPDDQKALKATVRTFPDSDYDLEELLTGLGTGEAVVTVLSEKGAPTPVAATRLRAPESRMGPVEEAELERRVRASALHARYAQAVDRESAYERLAARPTGAKGPDEMRAAGEDTRERSSGKAREAAEGGRPEGGRPEGGRSRRSRAEEEKPSVVEQVTGSGVFRSLARSMGTQIGREISRSLFGTARRRRR